MKTSFRLFQLLGVYPDQALDLLCCAEKIWLESKGPPKDQQATILKNLQLATAFLAEAFEALHCR